MSGYGQIQQTTNMTIFFLLFLENRIWHFVQIVSSGDNLHEVPNPIFLGKIRKYFEMSSADIFTQHAKCASTWLNSSMICVLYVLIRTVSARYFTVVACVFHWKHPGERFQLNEIQHFQSSREGIQTFALKTYLVWMLYEKHPTVLSPSYWYFLSFFYPRESKILCRNCLDILYLHLQCIATPLITLGKIFSRRQIEIFSYFSQKTRFDIPCKSSIGDDFSIICWKSPKSSKCWY